MTGDVFWAGMWALAHAVGLVVMLVLRQRSARQVRVAERWRGRAAAGDREEAEVLVALTRDRHRRNEALAVVAGIYLALGLLALSVTLAPWLRGDAYRTIARATLVIGELIWIGSAWASVTTGDRIARVTAPEARSS